MSYTIWFTGLSGAGKSTIGALLHNKLKSLGIPVFLIDGDVARNSICRGLSFSHSDRLENLRRIGCLASQLNNSGIVCVVAAIAPYADARVANRLAIANYIEVYCDCPLEVAETRDVKGLYRRARSGEIKNFTGISDGYDIPSSPELVLRTSVESAEESLHNVLNYLVNVGLLAARERCVG